MADARDLRPIAGPASMQKPPAAQSSSSGNAQVSASAVGQAKKKKHRAGRKHNAKKRRQSFAAPSEATVDTADEDMQGNQAAGPGTPYYRMQRNRSNTSLESEALLDHREHGSLRPRRHSIQRSSFTRPSLPYGNRHRGSTASAMQGRNRPTGQTAVSDDEADVAVTDRTPLLNTPGNRSRPDITRSGSGSGAGVGASGGLYGHSGGQGFSRRGRRSSAHSKSSSRRRIPVDIGNPHSYVNEDEEYDVNNPPSVPASPVIGSLDDIMRSEMHSHSDRGRDVLIDIDGANRKNSSSSPDIMRRRATAAGLAERDVCFPGDGGMSEIGEEEDHQHSPADSRRASRKRRRARMWPDLEILDDWSREEKEERTHQEYVRAKRINEPVLVGGRLRPGQSVWHREQDDAPFRFTYFNEMIDGTIHARTISDLVQDGASFKDLFVPDPVELSDDSEDDYEDDDTMLQRPSIVGANGYGQVGGKQPLDRTKSDPANASVRSPSVMTEPTGTSTPQNADSQDKTTTQQKPKRLGPRPTFWLDVLSPTEMEMKVLSKAFGIHQLTTEDILMEEQREKVELFQNYYFVSYRSFEQDKEDEDYLEPVNFYIVVFRDGVITFHHSMTPHPANVRRRIRALNDYMSPSADWISYAIIDDITDAFAPLTAFIEREVDEIDDEILYMHQTFADSAIKADKPTKPAPTDRRVTADQARTTGRSGGNSSGVLGMFKRRQSRRESHDSSRPLLQDSTEQSEKEKVERPSAAESGGEMLRRVGECRKKVMGLYRLLGNKADVLKGFAKRCNERWEVAPRSEIGLYLGDIQDHINTMTANVQHYESLLSRAHSNYVAQINIRMNERAEQNADVLGKLTVLGTIVLPMNIITGMWGMNVWVPGQQYEGDLTWFWCITAGLLTFGVGCYFVAKKVYGIV